LASDKPGKKAESGLYALDILENDRAASRGSLAEARPVIDDGQTLAPATHDGNNAIALKVGRICSATRRAASNASRSVLIRWASAMLVWSMISFVFVFGVDPLNLR